MVFFLTEQHNLHREQVGVITNRRSQNPLWEQLDRHTTKQPVRAVYPIFPLTMFALRGRSGKPIPLCY